MNIKTDTWKSNPQIKAMLELPDFASSKLMHIGLLVMVAIFIASGIFLILAANRFERTRVDLTEANIEIELLNSEVSALAARKIALGGEIQVLIEQAGKLKPQAKLSSLVLEGRGQFSRKNFLGAAKNYEEAFGLSGKEDASLLNQAAWSYYLASTQENADTGALLKSRELFENGQKLFGNNSSLLLNYALFLAAQGEVDSSFEVMNGAWVSPSLALEYASAPQTRPIRSKDRDYLRNWSTCLQNAPPKCELKVADLN